MTDEMKNYAQQKVSVCRNNDYIAPILYKEYDVNLGPRDEIPGRR